MMKNDIHHKYVSVFYLGLNKRRRPQFSRFTCKSPVWVEREKAIIFASSFKSKWSTIFVYRDQTTDKSGHERQW